VRPNPVLAVEEPRQLAKRHPMTDRHRRQIAGEADHGLVEGRAFDLKAVDWIRPVENVDGQALLRGLFHDVRHGGHVRVEARADVLEVDHQGVESLEHRGGRPARLAIKGMDHETCLLVLFRGNARIENPANAVFRTEKH
jgi:hypothetical protein